MKNVLVLILVLGIGSIAGAVVQYELGVCGDPQIDFFS